MPIYATIINFYANIISIFFKFKCNCPLYMRKLTQTRPVQKSARGYFYCIQSHFAKRQRIYTHSKQKEAAQ